MSCHSTPRIPLPFSDRCFLMATRYRGGGKEAMMKRLHSREQPLGPGLLSPCSPGQLTTLL